LANFEKKNSDLKKGEKLFTAKNSPKDQPDPEHSYKFYHLLMECLLIWPEMIPEGFKEKKNFEKKFKNLKSLKLTFPGKDELKFFF
jgi:hypothetical protein